MTEESSKVLSRLQAQCSKREYCSKDIYKKALTATDNAGEAEEILNSLVAEKYVDDLRYSSAYAREKAHISGWGPVKISYMLSSKGVARDVISRALAEVDEAAADVRLDKLLESKWKSVEGEADVRLRLIRFALTRGYEYNDVADAVARVMAAHKG